MKERYVHALWCDDVRIEVGNKPSFMGVFTGGMLLPSLPAILPRLGVYAWIASPIDQPIKSFKFECKRDDGEILAAGESAEQIPVGELGSKREGATRRGMEVSFMLQNVPILEGTRFLVFEVTTESETLEGPKLFIQADAARHAQAFGRELGPTPD